MKEENRISKKELTFAREKRDILKPQPSFPKFQNEIFTLTFKEVISAIKVVCNFIAKGKYFNFRTDVKKIETRVNLHPAINRGFSSLCGYTSDTEKIRHV